MTARLRLRLDSAVRSGMSLHLSHSELRAMMEHVKNLEQEVKSLTTQCEMLRRRGV